MGRGMGRRRRRRGDQIALRGSAQFGGGTAVRTRGGGTAEKEPELSAIEKALLAQARGPGLIVTPASLSTEERWAISALSARRLIRKSGKTPQGASIFKAD